jgi:hypothetical protein
LLKAADRTKPLVSGDLEAEARFRERKLKERELNQKKRRLQSQLAGVQGELKRLDAIEAEIAGGVSAARLKELEAEIAKMRGDAERRAQKVMADAYADQKKRITAELTSSGGSIPDSTWEAEPAKLTQSVQPFYEQTALLAAREGLARLPIDVDWDIVNKPVLALARARAASFGDEATATSQERTAARVASWVESGGTMAELIDSVAEVWSGPRADVAAATEVTDLYSAGNLAAWTESGVVSGFNFNTAEDPLVDPDCAEAAADGPYDLDDDEHRPPLHPNCRCWVTPVVKAPEDV